MNKYQKKQIERRKRRIKSLIKRYILMSTLLILLITILVININKSKQNDENLSLAENTEAIDASTRTVENKITDWELILVNKDNQLSEDYEIELKDLGNGHKVDTRIVENLTQMLNDARKQGLTPVIASSYREHSKQQTLYNNKIKEFKNMGYSQSVAEEKASYWVAIPGTSEHQVGLAVDIVDMGYQLLDEEQEKTDVQKWLIENCYKYGFILRYPTEKKDITKINYEPWHYRYVGVEHAKIIKEKGFCLEEYIDYLNEHSQV